MCGAALSLEPKKTSTPIVFREKSEIPSANMTLVAIETKRKVLFDSENTPFDRVKRLESGNKIRFSEQDLEPEKEEGRSLTSGRLTDLQALEKLERYHHNGATESPRGVQDQFIEMLGNSK